MSRFDSYHQRETDRAYRAIGNRTCGEFPFIFIQSGHLEVFGRNGEVGCNRRSFSRLFMSLKQGEFRLRRMTKQQLIEAVAGRTVAKKSEVEANVEALLKTVTEALPGDELIFILPADVLSLVSGQQ